MRTRNANKTFHLVSSLIRCRFQKPDSHKQILRSSSKFWRLVPLLVFAALVGLSFLGLSKHLFGRSSSVIASTESISTFDSDCTTPKTTWNLGGTACATATGAPGDRRIAWVAPDGTIARVSNFFSGSSSDSYQIPTGSDPFAQVGTWAVTTIDVDGVVSSEAVFVVRNPASPSANLSINNYGPVQTSAGNNINYRVEVTNRGPDAAENVVLTGSVPGDTTFVSETQDSGPAFTCTTPPTSGAINCTIASLPANATAIFSFTFSVGSGVTDGTVITSTVSISSSTNELHTPDNSASASSTVVAATSSCTITCPSVAPVSTSQCSAIVNYGAASLSGACGSNEEGGNEVVCSPPSGSAFPIGNTTVSCTSPSSDSCNFVVTVNYTGSTGGLAIICPANVSVETDLSAGTAQVNYPAPTTNGNCVTVVCNPPSGSSFPSGTTTVTCTATDPSNATATCSFTVTVSGTGGGGCTLTCSGDITQTASSGQCNAVVTYSAPTTSGSCGTVTCTPASGSTFPVGSTVVNCTSSDGATCGFTVTVVAPSAPTITTCASNKSITVNANCEGVIPNLLNEVVATGCNVVLSQSPLAGSLVPPGTYTVTITAENSAGEATCTATVTVADITAPTASCPAGTTVTAGSSCAVVPDVISGVTASDLCTPPELLMITQSPAAGTTVGSGTTTITVTVRDEAGNTTTCTTTFTVNDLTPPTITCPANIASPLPPNTTATSMAVTYAAPTASDNCGAATTSCVPASGSTFPVGATTVTCTATDAAGNSATCTFTVTVLYNFTGFFSPVSNPPALNTVNAGRAIPVKFSLSGNKGLTILATGYPASGVINCDANAPPNEVIETVTAGNSSLNYDASSDQYIYVWKTEGAWAGTCRQLVVKLNDGSSHVANFRFR